MIWIIRRKMEVIGDSSASQCIPCVQKSVARVVGERREVVSEEGSRRGGKNRFRSVKHATFPPRVAGSYESTLIESHGYRPTTTRWGIGVVHIFNFPSRPPDHVQNPTDQEGMQGRRLQICCFPSFLQTTLTSHTSAHHLYFECSN